MLKFVSIFSLLQIMFLRIKPRAQPPTHQCNQYLDEETKHQHPKNFHHALFQSLDTSKRVSTLS